MFARYLHTVGLTWFSPCPFLIGGGRSCRAVTVSLWEGFPPCQRGSWGSSLGLNAQKFWTPSWALGYSWSFMEQNDNEPAQKKRKSSRERHSKRIAVDEGRGTPPSPQHTNCESYKTPANQRQRSSHRPRPPAETNRGWQDFSCHYKQTQSIKGTQDHPFDFTVMSYNILSQDLLQDNAYLYKHCHFPHLHWSHRLPNILQEIQQHNADILCLQEVQEDHYLEQIKPRLDSLGYHSEYKRRTGRKPDGCSISFKLDRFSLVSCSPVEYFRRGVPLMDRDNVGLVLKLQPAGQASARLCVANTHLLYNPRRGDIKLAQLALLLAEISRVSAAEEGTTCAVVLCGDFNSVPWSPLYRFICNNRLEYEGILISKVSGQEQSPRSQRVLPIPIWPQSLGINQRCQYNAPEGSDTGDQATPTPELPPGSPKDEDRPTIEHNLRLTSVYSHYRRESGKPEITTCHSKTAITVDYIFYTAARGDVSSQPECTAVPEPGLHLLARLALMDEAQLQRINGLPNEHNCSDHLPLLARFRLCQ